MMRSRAHATKTTTKKSNGKSDDSVEESVNTEATEQIQNTKVAIIARRRQKKEGRVSSGKGGFTPTLETVETLESKTTWEESKEQAENTAAALSSPYSAAATETSTAKMVMHSVVSNVYAKSGASTVSELTGCSEPVANINANGGAVKQKKGMSVSSDDVVAVERKRSLKRLLKKSPKTTSASNNRPPSPSVLQRSTGSFAKKLGKSKSKVTMKDSQEESQTGESNFSPEPLSVATEPAEAKESAPEDETMKAKADSAGRELVVYDGDNKVATSGGGNNKPPYSKKSSLITVANYTLSNSAITLLPSWKMISPRIA